MEENLEPETGEYIYTRHSYAKPWVVGKLFRRQYLLDNNIRFHPDLRLHDDTYFIEIASVLTDRVLLSSEISTTSSK